jgi:ubiquinone/menaquinone biosynthesis C-methylase UbiE/spore maturation protein CgeB
MKILIAGSAWHDDLMNVCAYGFRELGHEVVVFNDAIKTSVQAIQKIASRVGGKKIAARFEQKHRAIISQKLEDMVQAHRPDFVFIINGSIYPAATIAKIRRKYHIPVAAYIIDDPLLLKDWLYDISNYSALFVIDKSWMGYLEYFVPGGVYYLPQVADHRAFHPLHLPRKHDFCFGGTLSLRLPNAPSGFLRAQILNILAERKYKIKAFVPGIEETFRYYPALKNIEYSNKYESHENLNKLYNESKITVSIHSPQFKHGISPRVFEAAFAKSFQLVEYKEDIESLFPECMVTFRSPTELLEKADYYLKNPQEREKISEKAYQYALRNHTFRHRGQVIIEIIKNSMEHNHSHRNSNHDHNNADEFNAGERYYPGETAIDAYSLQEHTRRYELATSRLPQNAIVLDAACGTGYGSKILAEKASKVYGIDISNHAIEWGKKQFENEKVILSVASLDEKLSFADATFDVVVSFETIEHVENQENMLAEFYRVLKPQGKLYISSPDREIITEKAHTENHFHINELSKKEFVAKLKKNFSIEKLYGQTKYSEIAKWKQLLKSTIRIIDPFKIRQKLARILSIKLLIHENFSPIGKSDIEEVGIDTPNEYFVLLAVCKKQ